MLTNDDIIVDEPQVESGDTDKNGRLYSGAELEAMLNERLNEIVPKRLSRKEAKLRKEYEEKLSKYKEVESVLKAGMGVEDIEEATVELREFYSSKGIDVPDRSAERFSEREIEIIANAEAAQIIELGKDEINDEVDRLANIGFEKMSQKEKAIFTKLASKRQELEQTETLMKLGYKPDIINDTEFVEFRNDFKEDTPLDRIVELYNKSNKKKIEKMGSMTGIRTENIKDFYTPDEVRRLSPKDLDDPQVMEAVERSMSMWNK